MRKLRVLIIGNNTSGDKDGIGKHARIVARTMEKNADTEYAGLMGDETSGRSKWGLMVSPVMTRVFYRIPSAIKEHHIDCVIIEYPFMEYNAWIVIALRILKRRCKKLGCRLGVSIHEFDRVKWLRKLVIMDFARQADLVFVTEEKMRVKLEKYNRNIYIRTLPNHLPITHRKERKNKKQFVYFGLISRAKAFDEMIAAWNVFNRDGKHELLILTSSDLKGEESWKNVCILRGLEDEEIAQKMNGASYCIVPVLPCVGLNNSTFITALQCRCIPLGKFDDNLDVKNFVVNLPDYSVSAFCDAFIKTTEYSESELDRMQEQAFAFGSQHTAERTVEQMVEAIRENVKP